LFFPQATRSKEIDENKFSSLAIKLAEKFKLNIIPICVKTDFLSVGKVVRDFGKVVPQNDVKIKIFHEIKSQEINKQTNKKIIELFKTKLAEWYAE
jgi:1-acyl-sn-glycerol-3-phosphate acyltransferase